MLHTALVVLLLLVQGAQPPEAPRPVARLAGPAFTRNTGPLFDNVTGLLAERYYDETFRKSTLPGLVARYRERAARASTLREQRQVLHDLLSEVPASHLGLLSRAAFDAVLADLQGRAYPNFGFQLIGFDGGFHAAFILENGPAQRAGLLHGDVVRTIDGVSTADSALLEWRSDDAYIRDERDPPVHMLRARAGDSVTLGVERRPGETVSIAVRAEEYSALDAARASIRVIRQDGRALGYVHFWYVHVSGVPDLLKEAFEGPLRDCDALLVDLRGRGGSFTEIAKILEVIRGDRAARARPVVALVDRQSRSGKDILAYELKQGGLARLVGEASAGAVIPATFADVGHETILMFPVGRLPRYTDALEFKPVIPDVSIERAGAFAAGQDPILAGGITEALRLLSAR